MTPEQVTKLKSWAIALLSGGIACLSMAYQYTIQPVGIGEPPPPIAPYLFGGIATVSFIVAATMWRKSVKSHVAPATTDLSSPQGRTVIVLLVLGIVALAGSYLGDYVVHNENLALVLSMGLLVVMIICFLVAARIGRNIRRAATTTGAVKE
jgi:predicted MFS family arabinose efflux permease